MHRCSAARRAHRRTAAPELRLRVGGDGIGSRRWCGPASTTAAAAAAMLRNIRPSRPAANRPGVDQLVLIGEANLDRAAFFAPHQRDVGGEAIAQPVDDRGRFRIQLLHRRRRLSHWFVCQRLERAHAEGLPRRRGARAASPRRPHGGSPSSARRRRARSAAPRGTSALMASDNVNRRKALAIAGGLRPGRAARPRLG